MKAVIVLFALALTLAGCSGPGGPATRAERAVDHAVYSVGTGVKHTGQAIQNAAD